MRKGKWNGARRVLGVMAVVSLLFVGDVLPAMASVSTYQDTEGAYAVTCNIPERVLDNTTAITKAHDGTLTITTQTLGVISSASLVLGNVGTVALTGAVGVGTNPKISLVGSAGGINVVLNGRVQTTSGNVTRITGKLDGFIIASGAATMASDESGTAAPSQVAQETGIESILLTQGAGAGSTHVHWVPQNGIRLTDLNDVRHNPVGTLGQSPGKYIGRAATGAQVYIAGQH